MGKRKKKHQKKSVERVPKKYKQPSKVVGNYDPEREEVPLVLSGYTITYEPIKEYSSKIRKKVTVVYDLLFSDPFQAIEQLKKLMEQYPQVPVFGNYMAIAYEQISDYEKCNYWLEENYRRHPDYLIARVNIGEKYLRKKQFDKVEEILDGKFDLKLLYPDREVFHVTEAVSLFGLVGKYYWFKGEKDRARVYYNLLKNIQPGCAKALYLKRVLHPFRFWLSPDGLKIAWRKLQILVFFPLFFLFSVISSLIKLVLRILEIR